MKAGLLTGIRELAVGEMPDPTPAHGEALVAIRAVGVCGSDVHYYLRGCIGEQIVREFPFVLGHEPAGEVVALGPGVQKLRVGDRVAIEPGFTCGQCEPCLTGAYNLCRSVRYLGTPPVHGAYCEFLAVPERYAHPLPPELSFEDGAMVEPLAVGVGAADLGEIRPGYSVAVLGAGSIGLTTMSAALAAGATQMLVSDPVAARREAAAKMGATTVYDPTKEDVVAAIMDATKGRGVDVVFEAAGSLDATQQLVEVVRPGGIIVPIGSCTEDWVPLYLAHYRRKGVTVKFVRRFAHTYPRSIQLARTGKVDLRTLVTHRCSFEGLSDAFRMVSKYEDGVIKAVFAP